MRYDVISDVGQVTVKEMLTGRLGEKKTRVVLNGINDGYQTGKRGDELQKYVKTVIGKVGIDPGEVKFVVEPILPNF